MKDSFSKRLKEILIIRNMRASELVKSVGIPKSGISQYLSGKCMPKREYLAKIAAALDVNETWLMGYDVNMERIDFDSMFNSSELAKEVKLIELIQTYYGKGAVQLLNVFCNFNDLGKQKALENILDISEIDKYSK